MINVDLLRVRIMVYAFHLVTKKATNVSVFHHFPVRIVEFFQIHAVTFQPVAVKTLYALRKPMVAIRAHANKDLQVSLFIWRKKIKN
jgi:hypothetical protein